MDHPAPQQRLPRKLWRQHPNFPDQVLLLGSHENFRRLSRELVGNCLSVADLAGLEQLYRRWISAMRSHEAYEEHKLYPYLIRRFGVSCEHAQRGHQELHARDTVVREAFAAATTEDTPTSRARLESALRAHDDALAAHLEVEESLVIPLLLELDRDEFETYCNHSIGELLRLLNTRDAGSK